MDIKLYDIPGYEGLYAINKQGDVWSYPKNWRNKEGCFLKKNESGLYYGVMLSRTGEKQKYKNIHKLLALTFLPNPDKKPCINHINGNKRDNSLDNLEWATYAENNLHAHRTGLWISTDKHKETARKLVLERDCKPIMQLTKEGILCKIYDSCAEAQRLTGIFNISRSATKNRTSGGYFWKYKLS